MPLPLGFVVFLLLPLCQVSGLKLSVQTNYFEIGGSGVTLECNLEGAAWNINNSPRTWSAPPNTLTVISDGLANAGYAEDLSDAATSGIIRMTTPPLDWSIENQFFQCSYQIDTSSLNATRNILARNSGGNASYDESTKKCVFTISEILPTPTKVVTHVSSGSGEFDISNDVRVMETITINNDQGQTYNYHIEVDGSKMKDGDQVKFRVKAGPYTENGSCVIKQETTTVHGTSPVNLGTTETSGAQNLGTLTTELTPSSSESITREANTTTSSQFTVITDIVSTTRRDLDVDDLLLVTVVSSVVGGIILIVIVAFVLYSLIKKIRGSSRKQTPHAPEMEGFDNKGMTQDRCSNKHRKGRNGQGSSPQGISNYRPKSLGTSYSTPYIDNGNPVRSRSEIGNDGYVRSSGRMYPSLPYAAYYSKPYDVAAIHTRSMHYNDRYLQHGHL